MLMYQYREQDSDLAMENIYVGSKYFPIPQDHYTPKTQKKATNTFEKHHAPGTIGGCDVSGKMEHDQ